MSQHTTAARAAGRALGCAALVFTAPAIAGAGHDHHAGTDSFSVTPVTSQITMLQGKGGNIAVLEGAQGLLMVDADFQHMSQALKAALQEKGGVEKLSYIVNTHWHGDHTQGNLELGSYAPIVAHDNVRARLLTKQEIKLFKMTSEPYPEPALPSLTYQQRMTMHFNGEQIQLVHYPASHTDGDSVLYFKNANVVHTGDLFFNGFFPFVDVDSGGSVANLAANVEQILQRIDDKTVLIPGHGPLAKKSDLEAFRQMLLGTQSEVKVMIDKGMTLEQMQTQGLSAQWEEWTDGFLSTDVWIGILYNSLMRN